MYREDVVCAHRALRQQVKSKRLVLLVIDVDNNDDIGRRHYDVGAQSHQETNERIHGVGARATTAPNRSLPGPSQLQHQQDPRQVASASPRERSHRLFFWGVAANVMIHSQNRPPRCICEISPRTLLPTGIAQRSEVDVFSDVCLSASLSLSLFVCRHDMFRTIKHWMMKLGGYVRCTKISPEFEC